MVGLNFLPESSTSWFSIGVRYTNVGLTYNLVVRTLSREAGLSVTDLHSGVDGLSFARSCIPENTLLGAEFPCIVGMCTHAAPTRI